LVFEIALRDPDYWVRREAGRALHRIGTDELHHEIEIALEERTTRKRAVAVLSEMYLVGANMDEYPWRARWRAKYRARRNVRREFRHLISDAGATALRAGVTGAVAWTGTVAFVYSLLATFVFTAVQSGSLLNPSLRCMIWCLVSSLILGSLLSLFAGRRAVFD